MMLASSVITHAKDNEGDPYFVVSRNYGPDDPLTPEEKLEIYRKVFPEQGHIFQTTTDELPALTHVLTNLNQQGYTNAIVVVGADQKAAFQYLNHYNGKPDKKGNIPFDFENLQVISRQETKDPSREEEGPRATPMRAVLMDPSKSHDEQFAVWRDAMSPEIDDEEVMALMHKAQQRMTQMAAAKKPKKKQGVAENLTKLGLGLIRPATKNIAKGVDQKLVTIYTNHKGATIDDNIKKSLPITDEPFNNLKMWEKNKSMKDPEIAAWVNNTLLPELEQNGKLKPLLLWNNNGQLFVIDGNHRFIAYQKAGYKGKVPVPVQIVPDDMITISDTVPG
jgi:hypothetical protein